MSFIFKIFSSRAILIVRNLVAILISVLSFFMSDETCKSLLTKLNFEANESNILRIQHQCFNLIVISSIACIIISVGLFLMEKTLAEKIQDLERQLELSKSKLSLILQDIKPLLQGHLHCFYSNKIIPIEKKNEGSHDRLTLYIVDEGKSHFIPIARISSNPNWTKPGRTQYPIHEGCIAKGWQNGWHFENKIPDKNEDRKKYIKDKYLISVASLLKIRMQSQVYASVRISCEKGNFIGVLVVESTGKNRFSSNIDKVKDLVTEEAAFLSRLILAVKPHIPTPNEAEKTGGEGF